MPELPGHDRRAERRARRRGRRLVRSGDEFTSDELERGEVELEERESSGPEPEMNEVWAVPEGRLTDQEQNRLRLYLEFVASRRREDPDYGDDS
jgi:hypothetical protein